MNMVLQGKVATIILVYGPQNGRNEEEKQKLYYDLTAKVQSRKAKRFVLKDFIGHVISSTY